MLFKEVCGERVSALGLGCMRFPVFDGDDARIDEEKAAAIVRRAMEAGVNYYDTAWPYHKGQSEPVMGRILSAYPRESFYLASKFPGFSKENFARKEEIFSEQLRRCGVEYFDFYLFHNVSDSSIEQYLDPRYGLIDFLRAQKAAGRIRHLGFSTHGRLETVERFLEALPEAEFCQIQLNYMDWSFQRAADKVALLRARGIPVWVMEPVRGGRLAALDTDFESQLHALRPDESIPAWAFRFLQGIEGLGVVLSGMSNEEQLMDNIKTMSEEKPLSDTERETLLTVAGELIRRTAVPCTGCRYCLEKCPQGLDIPTLLAHYNAQLGRGESAAAHIAALPEDKRPAACRACHSCEKVCPQGIKIASTLERFSHLLHG